MTGFAAGFTPNILSRPEACSITAGLLRSYKIRPAGSIPAGSYGIRHQQSTKAMTIYDRYTFFGLNPLRNLGRLPQTTPTDPCCVRPGIRSGFIAARLASATLPISICPCFEANENRLMRKKPGRIHQTMLRQPGPLGATATPEVTQY